MANFLKIRFSSWFSEILISFTNIVKQNNIEMPGIGEVT